MFCSWDIRCAHVFAQKQRTSTQKSFLSLDRHTPSSSSVFNSIDSNPTLQTNNLNLHFAQMQNAERGVDCRCICTISFDQNTMMKPPKRSTNRGPVSTDVASRMPSHRIIVMKDLSIQPQSRSEPIPIKKHKTDESGSIDPYDSVDTRAQYELATWVMYMRITTARRIRALSCSLSERRSSAESSNHDTGCANIVQPSISELDISRKSGCRNPFPRAMSPDLDQASFDVCFDGIFELE